LLLLMLDDRLLVLHVFLIDHWQINVSLVCALKPMMFADTSCCDYSLEREVFPDSRYFFYGSFSY